MILVVDDDAGLRELIGDYLSGHGYAVRSAGDVPSMRAVLAREKVDLIVLDIMMPGEDGLTGLRNLDPATRPPVILLSAQGADTDRIIGLELGADDYLAKPCNPRELLARVRAVLRRAGKDDGQGAVLEFDGWLFDPRRFELLDAQGQVVHLTTGEFRLFQALAEAGREVLSREKLAQRLGGNMGHESYDRAIDIAISRLRRKLAEHPGGEALIRTVRGEGYGFAAPVRRR